MVSADRDPITASVRPRKADRSGSGVRAVLTKSDCFGARNHGANTFGNFRLKSPRQGEDHARVKLSANCVRHVGIVVAKRYRRQTRNEIDVFVPVDVPGTTTRRPFDEERRDAKRILGPALRERLAPEWNDPFGPGQEHLRFRIGPQLPSLTFRGVNMSIGTDRS